MAKSRRQKKKERRPAPVSPPAPSLVHGTLAFFQIGDAAQDTMRLQPLRVALLLAIALHQLNSFPMIGVAFFGAAALSLVPGAGRWACLVGFVLLAGRHVSTFPDVSNHSYLESVLLLLLSLGDERRKEEGALALQGVRWLTVLVFVWAGLNKIWYGAYFDGRLFVLLASGRESFAAPFAQILSADEWGHIAALDPRRIGAGPFLPTSSILPAVANASWVAEIAIGVLLLIPATRLYGAIAGLGLLLVIEALMREVTFGLVTANLLFCSLPVRSQRIGAAVLGGIVLVLVPFKLGYLSGFDFM
ncbi:MAG: hypothetical protein P8R42_25035 [Candidatus Binatia bacterium]|nr:hypothetical protein [Candidatus Binatia bacterium]